LLGNNFFGPANFASFSINDMEAFVKDQGDTLIHEAIHAVLGASATDAQLFSNSVLLENGLDDTNWKAWGQTGAFTEWLDRGCTKKP
jgi:hypothetical protein